MAGIINSVIEKYNYVIYDLADSRTKDWWAVENPLGLIIILSVYFYFCISLGPRLMKNREPFQLKTILFLYNTFQICFSIFLTYEGIVFLFHKNCNLACEPIDYGYGTRALRIAAGVWFYYIAKISELLDTVFFILRKKFNQVTFLHVYHHMLMCFITWVGAKYFAGGHLVFMGFLNAIVHIIMYSYYLISSLGPEYQKYLWWKKYVTMIQLIQFLIVFVHNFAVFFYECDHPMLINVLCCFNALAFLYMFGKFYLKSYKPNLKSKAGFETKEGAKKSR